MFIFNILPLFLMININERFIGISALVLAVFIFQSQSSEKETLRSLLLTYEAEMGIQNSQIQDLIGQSSLERGNSYSEGFENGRTQAGIALANGESLYGYKEGYHAALTQFTEPVKSNNSRDSVFSDLLLESIDRQLATEESYWELLEYMTEDSSLKANAE